MVSRLQRDGSPHQRVQMHFMLGERTLDDDMLQMFLDKSQSNRASMPSVGGVQLAEELVVSSLRAEEGGNLDQLCTRLAGDW